MDCNFIFGKYLTGPDLKLKLNPMLIKKNMGPLLYQVPRTLKFDHIINYIAWNDLEL